MTETLPPPVAPPVSSAMSNAFDALDSFPSGPIDGQQPAPAPAPVTPPPTAAPAPETPKAPEAKPKTDIPDLPKPGLELDELGLPKVQQPKPTKAPEPEIKGPKELREAYQKVKEQLAEYEAYKAKAAELEAQLASRPAIKPEEIEKPWREKLTAAEKAQADLEERVRFLDYTKSNEFQEKYEKPLVEAHKDAMEDLKGLTVTDDKGQEREATIHDLVYLQRLPGGQAAKLAAAHFKEAAPLVLSHIQKMKQLATAQEQAMSQWKERGSQQLAEQARQQQEQQAAITRQFEEEVSSYAKKRPDLFDADPTIPEAKELLQKGYELNDRALRGIGIPSGLTDGQRREFIVKAQALMAARSAGFGPLVAKLSAREQRIAELESELSKFKAADPSPTPPKDASTRNSGPMTLDMAVAGIDSLR